MSKGEFWTDLEELKNEYSYKISLMSNKFRNNEYNHKTMKKMAEILAGYMSSYDEIKQAIDFLSKNEERIFEPSKYSCYKEKIIREYLGSAYL